MVAARRRRGATSIEMLRESLGHLFSLAELFRGRRRAYFSRDGEQCAVKRCGRSLDDSVLPILRSHAATDTPAEPLSCRMSR